MALMVDRQGNGHLPLLREPNWQNLSGTVSARESGVLNFGGDERGVLRRPVHPLLNSKPSTRFWLPDGSRGNQGHT